MHRPAGQQHARRVRLRVAKATAPFYWHAQANEQIGLYQGKLYVVDPKGRFASNGAVVATWRPSPYIRADASGPLKSRQLANPFFTETSIQLPSRVRLLSGLHVAAQPQVPHEPPSFATSTRESYRSIGRTHTRLDEVRFGLPNFPDVLGPLVQWPDGTGWRVRLKAPNHVVLLDARHDYSAVRDQLESEGGYALTHSGSLTPKRPLSVKSIEQAIEALYFFLTFAAGRWTGPVLPVGFERGRPVWAQWDFRQLDAWGGTWSWFDRHDGDALPTLYPRFLALWKDQEWRDAIRLAVAYWVLSNRPDPVQGAIVYAQVVLEMLAKRVLVTRGRLSRRAARGLDAGELIATMLQELAIDPAVPKQVAFLYRWASRSRPRLDGPTAVARLRNRVIHGDRAHSEPPFRVWTDAWRLSTQYVELSLLAILGYQGRYSNRLLVDRWVGQTESVPWVGPIQVGAGSP
jgi:hypothetical protein